MRILVFLALVAALVIFAIQNLTPTLTLVVLGSPTVALPLSVWLLGAAAVGALGAIAIFALAAPPPRRPYRPLGDPVRDPPPNPRRSEGDSTGPADFETRRESYPSAYASPVFNEGENEGEAEYGSAYGDAYSDSTDRSSGEFYASQPYSDYATPDDPYSRNLAADATDREWGSYRPPERWEDWGQPEPAEPFDPGSDRNNLDLDPSGFPLRQDPYSPRSPVDDALDDIESGWETDDAGDRAAPDYGYPEAAPAYDPGETGEDSPEEVYDADFRVIIPPYTPEADDKRS